MDFAVGWNRFNLSVLGVWPEPREVSKLWRWTSSFIFWSSTIITFAFTCTPVTVKLLVSLTSLDEIIENLSINVPITFALIKQIVLRYHGKALKFLLSQIHEDWCKTTSDWERQTMMKNAKLSRQISIVCSTLTYMMLGAFIGFQIWAHMQMNPGQSYHGFLHPGLFPYDVQKSPNYEISWFGQFIGTSLTAICYSCFDTFLAVLVLHLCGQLTVLRLTLENLCNATKEQNFKDFDAKLGFIVHRHWQLHNFAVTVENCFNVTLLVQTLISTAMFCLTGYRLLTSVDQQEDALPVVGLTFFVIHVIYTMLHLFIYCYIGEQLLGESLGIADSAYDCNWYDMPPKKAVLMVIVICRARAPLLITAGKFSPFSFELFNGVLKTSAGYLSVLLAMKDT